VAEVDLLGLLVVLEHREVDDPAEAELVFGNDAQLLADLVRARPANFQAASGLSATKNTASPSSAPVRAFSLSSRSPVTNLAIGPLPAPPSRMM
jgi:hypothetical protein